MRYFVLGPSGEKYGPADIDTLNAWIVENRVLATTMLMDEMSGLSVAASAVPGLSWPAPSPAPPSGIAGSGYAQPGSQPGPGQPNYGQSAPYQPGQVLPGQAPSGANQGGPYGPGPGGPYGQGTPGGPYVGYQRPNASMGGYDANKDLRIAWILAAISPFLSVFCFGGLITAGYGIRAAMRARDAGHPSAIYAIVVNGLCYVIWIAMFFFRMRRF